MFNSESALKKWAPILEHAEAPKIRDSYRKSVTAILLENQEKAMKEERAQSLNETTGVGQMQNFDPILISLVRRAMPNLIAYDIAGVQPMSAPTGLIFAIKPKYQSGLSASGVVSGADASYGGKVGSTLPNTASTFTPYYSSAISATSSGTTITINGILATGRVLVGASVTGATGAINDLISPGTIVTAVTTNAVTVNNTVQTIASGSVLSFANTAVVSSAFANRLATADGEALSGNFADTGSGDVGFKNMGFSIEKSTVTAVTRALKADYTMELAQDLKAVHGLDAESELANILSSEILFEINREVIDTINTKAVLGAQFGYDVSGTYNVSKDADGRWALERYKSLLVAIELEANQIAKDTRRGKGNIVICSSNVASALAATGVLEYSPALTSSLEVDDTGNTFAGVLNGRIKVYVDPYATTDYVTVGYRGTNPYDAGIFYAPYVPLTMVRAVDPATFQPKIAFKTRYGLVANPFVSQAGSVQQAGINNSNFYYRFFNVKNLSLRGVQAATAGQ